MALNENQAAGLARELMIAMAESGSIKTVGAATGAGTDEKRNAGRGINDAAYLASLYRELVIGLQK